jgi:hypothetical protein
MKRFPESMVANEPRLSLLRFGPVRLSHETHLGWSQTQRGNELRAHPSQPEIGT